jgi:hypothetical protein
MNTTDNPILAYNHKLLNDDCQQPAGILLCCPPSCHYFIVLASLE